MNADTPEMRKAIGAASSPKGKKKKNAWFKSVAHGEFLGDVIFNYIDLMEDKKLKEQLENLSDWIDA